ncbi:hypothetical protein [Bradyrhizobium australiense]|uniref:Uncharacterized protein n=1 Tax=Bradyrhizobium australiense TaxID=2721161 RepID=A0A7Y4GLT1_9BRAD|nr:hypothetical protein [Bradyrhizobium australiense]NOJ38094.1 hypothetical protein [Bradyrhizobium australiense]
MEEAVMEAVVMECGRKSGRESGMCKMRTREPAAAEMHASAHAAEAHTATAEVHATAAVHHATAAVHPATTAMHAAATAAVATAASRKRRWRHGKRRGKRTRDEAIKELVVHPNPSMVELQRRIASPEENNPADPNGPTISNDKYDSF